MSRKKRQEARVVRGIPGRVRAEKERRQREEKERELRLIVQRLQRYQSNQTSVRSDDDGTVASVKAQLFQEIRELALAPHGLLSNEFRQEIWPFLVGCADFQTVERHDPKHFVNQTAPHRDDSQVEKDIDRSLWHYDIVKSIKDSDRRSKRRLLTQIINAVLTSNEELNYFQGYHDICTVFLLAVGDQRAYCVVQCVSETYHREAMRSSFELVLHACRLLFPLIDTADEELFDYIRESRVEPFFVLPWMITWFAHQLERFQDVARLYDAFLVSHPLFSLYVSASVVLEARNRVLKCECDFGSMHGFLAKLPQTMDIEKVISRAVQLFHQLPPSQLLQQSEMANMLMSTTYFQFPFDYQKEFDITRPSLHMIPPLPRRRSRENEMSKIRLPWRPSYVHAAAAIGVVAVLCSYTFRDRIRLWQ